VRARARGARSTSGALPSSAPGPDRLPVESPQRGWGGDAPLVWSPGAQQEYAGFWTAAHVVAEDNARSRTGRELTWAHGSLVELYVLAQLLPEGHWARREAGPRADQHLQAMMQTASGVDGYTLRRQLLRYADWWWIDREDLRALPARLGARMAELGVEDTHVEDG
jgi:hypothetical protein